MLKDSLIGFACCVVIVGIPVLMMASLHYSELEHSQQTTAKNIKQIQDIKNGPETAQLIVWIPGSSIIVPADISVIPINNSEEMFVIKGPKEVVAEFVLQLHEIYIDKTGAPSSYHKSNLLVEASPR